jgi:hypothetical protein
MEKLKFIFDLSATYESHDFSVFFEIPFINKTIACGGIFDGMRTLELLNAEGISQLHSRKLRSFSEVAFQ